MPRVFSLPQLQADLPAAVVASLDWPADTLVDGRLRVRCREHDLEYLIFPGNLRRGQRGCPVCADAGRSASRADDSARAISEAFSAATKAHEGKYDYSRAAPRRVSDEVEIGCPDHGWFRQTLISHSRGHGCSECANDNRGKAKTAGVWGARQGQIALFCEAAGLRVLDDLTTPRKWLDQIQVACAHHGEFTSTVRSLMQGKGCWKCFTEFRAGQKRNQVSAETFVARAVAIHEGKYDYSRFVYVDAKTKGEIICKKHNKVFLADPGNHIQGKGCPKCGVQLSKGEEEIAAFLRQHTTVIQRDQKIIAPLELDIYMPDHGFAVEFHGLFWHTENKIGGRHRDKWKDCTDRGIELWQVFEDEWRDSADKVRARLLARIGVGAKFAARRCEVVALTRDEATRFLDAKHLQGGKAGSVNLGLKFEGVLVAVATFGQLRTGAMVAGEGWEVLRYASQGAVVGGFGKLFAEFLRRTAATEVVSFCDLRWGNGRVYKATGFVLEKVTPPDYWWLPYRSGKHRIPRYQTQKHKLKTHPTLKHYYREDSSESEICAAAGWEKILGVGHQRWVWTRPQNPDTLRTPNQSFS